MSAATQQQKPVAPYELHGIIDPGINHMVAFALQFDWTELQRLETKNTNVSSALSVVSKATQDNEYPWPALQRPTVVEQRLHPMRLHRLLFWLEIP
jgi:hypothetical protein